MVVDVVIAAVDFAVAVMIVVSVRRAGTRLPWLLALALYFTIRGVDRTIHAFGDPPDVIGQIAEAVVVVTLVLLLVGLPRTIDALRAAHERATRRTRAYERALHDYRQLVRHRLANPLAAVRGGVQTLREVELSDEEREQLLAMLHEQVLRLERLSLEPTVDAPEESGFRPAPKFRARDG